MGTLIKNIIVSVGSKVGKIDPTDVMTQDTVKSFIDILKEVVLP